MYFGTTVYRFRNKPSQKEELAVIDFLKENCEPVPISFTEARKAFRKTFVENQDSIGFSLVLTYEKDIKGVAIINFREQEEHSDDQIEACIIPDQDFNNKGLAKQLIFETITFMQNELRKEELIANALRFKN